MHAEPVPLHLQHHKRSVAPRACAAPHVPLLKLTWLTLGALNLAASTHSTNRSTQLPIKSNHHLITLSPLDQL